MKTATSTNSTCNGMQKNLDINIDISGTILTPLACGTLVNEILKGLLYQKSQIPYPYDWMKTVVNKKRNKNEEQLTTVKNFTVENHFRVVSTAYDTLEEIMKAIINEFTLENNHIKEVIILMGTSPLCPKEVYTINVSDLASGHIERNHINEINKLQPKILRSIFLSQAWMDLIDATTTCSNTFVLIKKEAQSDQKDLEDPYFIPCKSASFSDKVKHVKINLNYDKSSDKKDCCCNLTIYQDGNSAQTFENVEEPGCNTNEKCTMWCQSKKLVKGFRDCFVNKVSASQLW